MVKPHVWVELKWRKLTFSNYTVLNKLFSLFKIDCIEKEVISLQAITYFLNQSENIKSRYIPSKMVSAASTKTIESD